MTHPAKHLILGSLALMCVFAAPSARASITYTSGDLLLAFRKTGDTNTFVVNLGAATSFRDAASAFNLDGTIGDINTDLTSIYGASWYTDSNVFASIVGAKKGLTGDGTVTTPPPNAANSVYASKAGTGSPLDTAFATMSRAAVATATNQIDNGFGTGGFAANGTATANSPTGAIIATSTANDYTDYIPPTSSAFFSTMPSSTEANPNETLNLYRILSNITGASDAPSGDGVSQFQGSFAISNTGSVTFTPESVGAVPEPSRAILLGLGLSGLLMRRRRKA